MKINYTVPNPWGTCIKSPPQSYITLTGITDLFALPPENNNKSYFTHHFVEVVLVTGLISLLACAVYVVYGRLPVSYLE
jgi:hypothetical protein